MSGDGRKRWMLEREAPARRERANGIGASSGCQDVQGERWPSENQCPAKSMPVLPVKFSTVPSEAVSRRSHTQTQHPCPPLAPNAAIFDDDPATMSPWLALQTQRRARPHHCSIWQVQNRVGPAITLTSMPLTVAIDVCFEPPQLTLESPSSQHFLEPPPRQALLTLASRASTVAFCLHPIYIPARAPLSSSS